MPDTRGCPCCEFELPADAPVAEEIAHMTREHPEVIASRLAAAGERPAETRLFRHPGISQADLDRGEELAREHGW